ncbi:hypothetical protein V8D89_004695 [Ganoderma adspersum]
MPVLTPGAIYAAPYWRPDGKYHWAIIVADNYSSGQKLHATNLETTERKPLVVLGQIGKTKSGEGSASIASLLRHVPLVTPEYDEPHPFSCRIWFREAVRVLIAQGAVACQSVDAMEKELTELADADGDSIVVGGQWKVYDNLASVRL